MEISCELIDLPDRTYKKRGLIAPIVEGVLCLFTQNLAKLLLVGASIHLKNISQIGSFPQIGVWIKNLWNHHLDW